MELVHESPEEPEEPEEPASNSQATVPAEAGSWTRQDDFEFSMLRFELDYETRRQCRRERQRRYLPNLLKIIQQFDRDELERLFTAVTHVEFPFMNDLGFRDLVGYIMTGDDRSFRNAFPLL